MILVITLKLVLFIVITIFILRTFLYLSKAAPTKANLVINTRQIIGKIPQNWKALAQGGEEMNVRMLQGVIPQISALNPRYIRIDHIYDFYNVVQRNANNLDLNWIKLDEMVCDIYHSGAKPFFVLGYMPEALSGDNTLVSQPLNYDEWAFVVQKTIERYSGKSTRICDQIYGDWLSDIYYEVWNEPDLETFGKWSIYNGAKDYKSLYYYSAMAAQQAQNVYHFNLGGPVTTALYRNWILNFLNYVDYYNLKLDFISWHHYTKNADDYYQDLVNLNTWLADDRYLRFRQLPKIISEWGYDSNPNPVSETSIGAAHTVMSIRNLVDQNLSMAFAFDIKDGPEPRWGILSHSGEKKPRYHALKILNQLDEFRLNVQGEGTYVRALASYNQDKISVILVNYDQRNTNFEMVPVTFTDLLPGNYLVSTKSFNEDNPTSASISVLTAEYKKDILMPPNSIISLELKKIN